jgi:hypothetical protein
MGLRAVLLMVAIPALAGCHPVGTSSCEIASDSGEWVCFEWEGEPYASTQDQCKAFGTKGRWSDRACPRSRAVGGCRLHVGTRTFTEWRGGGAVTEERLRQECQLKSPAGTGIRAEYLPGEARPTGDAGGID